MKIAIIAGGQTAEASGTLGSAAQLVRAGQTAGHEMEVVELPDGSQAAARWNALEAVMQFDVAIPLIAGLEGTLELLGVPYVGSPPDAAAIAANKVLFNAVASDIGLRKVPYEVHDVSRTGIPSTVTVPGPWYIKPARLGASYGITRVDSSDGLAAAVRTAAQHDTLVLVEQEVPRPFVEVEVAAIVGEAVQIAPPMEIHAPGAVWRDPSWKYSLDERPMPYENSAVADECVAFVRTLIARIGLAGALRFDLFISGDNNVFVGEVNALPGHGVASTFPRIFEHAGLGRDAQVDSMLAAALHLRQAGSTQRVRA